MKDGGTSIWQEAGSDKITAKSPTITCAHCNRIVRYGKQPQVTATVNGKSVIVRPGLTLAFEDVGGFCRLCMKPVCGTCCDRGTCVPFEEKLSQYENARSSQRSMYDQLPDEVRRAFEAADANPVRTREDEIYEASMKAIAAMPVGDEED